MYVICAKVLRKLVSRGLVSEANINEQIRELKAEAMKEYGVKSEAEMILLLEQLIKAKSGTSGKPDWVN